MPVIYVVATAFCYIRASISEYVYLPQTLHVAAAAATVAATAKAAAERLPPHSFRIPTKPFKKKIETLPPFSPQPDQTFNHFGNCSKMKALTVK